MGFPMVLWLHHPTVSVFVSPPLSIEYEYFWSYFSKLWLRKGLVQKQQFLLFFKYAWFFAVCIFSRNTVIMYCFDQFTVTLQCEELIAEEYKSQAKQDRAVTSFSNYHEVCLSLKQCSLNLPIPLHVTPAFTTQLGNNLWDVPIK